MDKKIMLFGFDQLPVILAAEQAAAAFGAKLRVVTPRDASLTIGALAEDRSAPAVAAPVALTGQMAVLCGLEDCLDGALAALRAAGVLCPKAVLTDTNRTWTAPQLLAELRREQAAMTARKGGGA